MACGRLVSLKTIKSTGRPPAETFFFQSHARKRDIRFERRRFTRYPRIRVLLHKNCAHHAFDGDVPVHCGDAVPEREDYEHCREDDRVAEKGRAIGLRRKAGIRPFVFSARKVLQ